MAEDRILKAQRKAEKYDNAFQRALTKKYGSRAGDVRYRPKQQTPKIRALGRAYHRAVEQWRKAKQSNPAGSKLRRVKKSTGWIAAAAVRIVKQRGKPDMVLIRKPRRRKARK